MSAISESASSERSSGRLPAESSFSPTVEEEEEASVVAAEALLLLLLSCESLMTVKALPKWACDWWYFRPFMCLYFFEQFGSGHSISTGEQAEWPPSPELEVRPRFEPSPLPPPSIEDRSRSPGRPFRLLLLLLLLFPTELFRLLPSCPKPVKPALLSCSPPPEEDDSCRPPPFAGLTAGT